MRGIKAVITEARALLINSERSRLYLKYLEASWIKRKYIGKLSVLIINSAIERFLDLPQTIDERSRKFARAKI